MQAIYTCSTTTGSTVAIELSDKTTIEDIKARAAQDHGVIVVDVLAETLLGNLADEEEELDEE